MPVQEIGEGYQTGAARNFLVGKADLDGLIGSLEFNELGHCLVSRFVGRLGELYHLPTSLYQQWPQLLLHRYGLETASVPTAQPWPVAGTIQGPARNCSPPDPT